MRFRPEWPRKRTILAAHRWLGILSALFLLLVALTGLALNHAERLGLNRIKVRSSLILERYGMAAAGDIGSWRIHGTHTLSHLGDMLFIDGEPIAEASEPVGLLEGDPFTVVAAADALVFLTADGELVERIDAAALPFAGIRALGRGPGGEPVVVADDGQWAPDADWLAYEPSQLSYTVEPLRSVELPAAIEAAVLAHHQGDGLPLYRILLDLHSGRLFGWGGRTLMDLTAVAIILLVSSGVAGWLRKSRWARG